MARVTDKRLLELKRTLCVTNSLKIAIELLNGMMEERKATADSDVVERLQLAECHAVHGPDVTEAVTLINSLQLELASYMESHANMSKHLRELERQKENIQLVRDNLRKRVEELEQTIGRLCDAAGFELEFWLENEDG